MITYVNTVLVNDGEGVMTSAITPAATKDAAITNAGKFIVVDNNGTVLTASTAANADAIKIGKITNKTVVNVNNKTGETKYMPIIKWSNIIKKADVKSYNKKTYVADTEDSVVINLGNGTNGVSLSADEEDRYISMMNKRIVVRLTFKDLPTRYRKWTESYEYIVKPTDTKATIVEAIANEINKQYKRARVTAQVGAYASDTFTAATTDETKAAAYAVKLTAMPYDDDESVDSISPANKVRFSATMWMTDPAAEGFASKNKYSIVGLVIAKEEGVQYTASAKLVRDLEAGSLGYQGIINHGEGTWPIIKPDMAVKLDGMYDAITLEFENMYRTADDLQRKTKQAVNLFVNCYTGTPKTYTANSIASVANVIESFLSGVDASNSSNATTAAANIKKTTSDLD